MRIVAPALALVVLLLAGCGKPEEGGRSPEQVAERYERIMRDKDYDHLLSLFPPENRELVTLWITTRAGLMAAMGALADRPGIHDSYTAIIERHGLEELEAPRKAGDPHAAARRAHDLFRRVDRARLVGDLVRFFDRHSQGCLMLPRGRLNGLQVRGDTARGEIGGKRVEFSRHKTRWYADLPVD